MTGWQPPNKEDFDAHWLTPGDAVEMLCDDRLERSHWELWILERLRTGLIVGVGRTGNPRGKLEEFPPVLPRYWRTWDDYRDNHFWLTGDAKFTIDTITGYGDGKDIRFFDVRLDPDGFSGQLPKFAPIDEPDASTSPPEAARRQDLPRLPDPIAQAWAEWFKGQPGASKETAEKEALRMFPNHNFSRERIRDLIGPKPMGRPAKTKG